MRAGANQAVLRSCRLNTQQPAARNALRSLRSARRVVECCNSRALFRGTGGEHAASNLDTSDIDELHPIFTLKGQLVYGAGNRNDPARLEPPGSWHKEG